MKIFDIIGARQRRSKILASTDRNRSTKDRYQQAYNKCYYAINNSHNPLTKLKARKDSEYFKRKLERYR